MLPAGLRPLRHRAFALFWGAGVASDMGTWMQLATIASLVASESGSALSIALIAGATFAPQGICSPLGGVLADRVDRRRLFLVTLLVQTVVTTAIGIAVFSGVRDATSLSLLVLIQSGAGALGAPALQAVLPDLVPREELTAAVSLGILSWNAGRVVGPMVAALLIPVGPGWAIMANAISFAVLWVAIAFLRRPFLPAPRVHDTLFAELTDGARTLVRTRACLVAVATLAVLHFTYIPFMGLVPSTARRLVLHTGGLADRSQVTSTASRLYSAQGIGAVLGSLILASLLLRFRRSSIIVTALSAIAVLLPLHVLLPSLPLACLAIAGLGAGSAMAFAAFSGVVQREAPAEHRGRVLSWQQGVMGISYGAALWLHGTIADHYGLPLLFSVGGAATLLVAIVAVRNRRWTAVIDHQPVPVVVLQPA